MVDVHAPGIARPCVSNCEDTIKVSLQNRRNRAYRLGYGAVARSFVANEGPCLPDLGSPLLITRFGPWVPRKGMLFHSQATSCI